MVVRRLVPGELGPTGGPAFTDVLGVCTSWGDGVCVVQPSAGPPVSIPLDLIVSGKPVPPRPSTRLRVSAREAESHAAPIWPGVERVPLGEWELRSDPRPLGRLVKRANSCLAMGSAAAPFEAAVETVRDFYVSRERPVMVQVEADSSIEEAFREAGWTTLERGEASFRLVSTARLNRGLSASPDDAESPRLDVNGQTATAALPHAHGRATLDGDWLGLHDLHVDPAHRRQGLARRVVAELAAWGAEQGARTTWLHVETDNAPALALYDSLGFLTHHTCRYLTPP
ncbi:MAG: GNAT family N-acetyltransferase [Nocardioides sp.]|uniref:GNAT family N-acetyltransferase n=1 Tax=Nocardioides sp. TaxID=35761 RepID=UPI0039E659F5